MPWFQIFQDGPEYEARKRRGKFTPPVVSLKQLRDAVPHHLFERSTTKSLAHMFRHFVIILWLLYWGWQGIAFAGRLIYLFQAGHNALSSHTLVNTAIGLTVHTLVLTPYYSWRVTHNTHHKSTNNIDRDETYVPQTRQDFKLPDDKVTVRMDYAHILEETPAYTLFKLFVRQFFGFQLYLLHNRKGNPRYPPGTSHYKPSSKLFRPKDRLSILFSNIILLTFLTLLIHFSYLHGWFFLWNHYFLPWLGSIVLFTYLQHSDPTIPYYRKDQWTFARGALATVDRPLFGWVGRFFLHNISSDHVAHHFFPTVPFYNLPEVTKAIKPVLGDYYNYDSTPALYALWRSFTQCTFVEPEGDILFFKNQYGEALVTPNFES
ncbi:fatty acid desaturase-domain-containing protein [Gymnopilus junonius]|uniref:Fatty acid desaturase-domain-containing protein n=1 Tax=Gymnopilus junonius TaxID=109634 RepID=A0A9P5TJM5_GYMJU|nr:fatty acid desaturase-domain-containing protein [Gymnopilus junonius]